MSERDDTRKTSRWDLVRDPIIGPLGIAQLVSALGSAMNGLAIVYLSYDRTGSVFRAVLVTAAYTMPAAIFGVWAGRLAQHRNRRQILVTVYTLKMLVYAAMAVMELTVGLTANDMLVISLITGTIGAFSYPAWQAFERDVVAEDELDRVNAFFSSLTASADLVGIIAGGVVLGAVGAGAIFVFNAVTYIPEIVLLWRLHPKERLNAEAPKGHEMRRAIRTIRSTPMLRRGFVSLVVLSILAAPIAQLLPGLAHEINGQAHTLAILTAAMTLGGVAVIATLSRLRKRHDRRAIVALGLLGLSLTFIGLGIADVFLNGPALFPPVFVGLVIVGLTVSLADDVLSSIIQANAPDDISGPIFAVYAIVYTTVGPASALVMAGISDRIDVFTMLSICGTILLLFALSRLEAVRNDAPHPAQNPEPRLATRFLLHGVAHRRSHLSGR